MSAPGAASASAGRRPREVPAGSPARLRVRTARLATPPGFSFERTVFSHGWFDLPPFRWDPHARALTCTLHAGPRGAAPVDLTLREARPGGRGLRIEVRSTGRPPARERVELATRCARRMLRLDEDFGAFHERARRVARPDLRWVEPAGAGRLLRAPRVFEDLVKLICTTNCGWPLTRIMIAGLVEGLGDPSGTGTRAFPSPEAMAEAPPRFYRDVMRAGYRAGPIRTLARRVADAEIAPESWADPSRDDAQVRAEILSIDGAGPYVADNLMKLAGRYSGLGIDAWARRTFSRMYARGRRVPDARIERFYAPFGPWRGLALWCDITRDWFGADGRERAREKFTHAAW